ncbi:lipase family protein [Sphingorhabdus sp. EL138]|uniref:alpha/beta hydrolase n=1 Tax=Sphingorhabdus sp. EL138 TaxID=2073156 RepID=UPI001C1FB8E6|nr:lipase family protein [Sphingorhabdus sp. EL138]
MKNSLKIVAIASSLLLAGCSTMDETASMVKADNPPSNMTLGDSYLSDFYSYDGALAAPGMLLRKEPLNEQQSNPGAGENVRLLYSSTDGLDGEALLPVSGVLFLPEGAAPAGGWPLMAWTHGTVGIADICAPSWNGRQQQDRDHLEFWLKNGYAVVASDYQGLGTAGTHPYLATRPEAYSNLDIIRAVQSSEFPVSDKVVLFGQSQGAGAAIATAAYAEGYAPDVNIVGAVATGVPFFSPEALIALQESRPRDRVDPMLGYNLLALSLVQRINKEFKLGDYVSDEVMPIAQSVQNTCHKDVKAKVIAEKLTHDRVFKQAPDEHLYSAFSQMGYPTLKLPVPTFVGTGAKDKDTPPRMQSAFVKRACKAGSNIVSKLYPTLDHRAVVPGSTGDTLSFVKAAFAGDEIESNCGALPF